MYAKNESRKTKKKSEREWKCLRHDFLFDSFVPFSVMKCTNGGNGSITIAAYI